MAILDKLRSGVAQIDDSVKRIADVLDRGKARAKEPEPSREPEKTTSPVDVTRLSTFGLWGAQRIERDRLSVVRDSWDIYLSSDEAHVALNSLGEISTAGDNNSRAFRLGIVGSEDDLTDGAKGRRKEVLGHFDQWLEREGTDLRSMAPQIATRTLIEADRFYEIVVNTEDDEVVELRYIPGIREGYIMKRLEDEPTGALVGWALYHSTGLERIKIYHPWQIVHFCWNRIWRFGLPLLVAARLNWRRLCEEERDLYIMRHARSGLRTVFSRKDWTIDDIKAMQTLEEQRRRSHPEGPLSNGYTNADNVTVIDPKNTGLGNIADVEYLHDKLICSTRMMKVFLGSGEDVNRATAEMQFQWQLPLFDQITNMLTRGFLKVMRTQMILRGMDPTEHTLALNWTDKDPTEWAKRMAAWTQSRQLGQISQETYHEKVALDPALEKVRLRAEMEDSIGLEEVERGRMRDERIAMLQAEVDDLRRGGGNGDRLHSEEGAVDINWEELVGARR